MSCGVGCRRGSYPALLWLWCRLVATALIRPLAWEPPYAAGEAPEKAKRPKKKKREDSVRDFIGIVTVYFTSDGGGEGLTKQSGAP